jgi:hypothetical protein
MRYQENDPSVWLTPFACWQAGEQPVEQLAVAKDQWIAQSGVETLVTPPADERDPIPFELRTKETPFERMMKEIPFETSEPRSNGNA